MNKAKDVKSRFLSNLNNKKQLLIKEVEKSYSKRASHYRQDWLRLT